LQRLSYPSVDIIQKEKKTFLLHLISQFFNGIVAGIIVIQEIILKKSLSGTNFEVTILIYLTSISFLFSIYGTEIIDRSDNMEQKLLTAQITGQKLFSGLVLSVGDAFCLSLFSLILGFILP